MNFFYFDCILVLWPAANSKRKCKHFALTLSSQAAIGAAGGERVHARGRHVGDEAPVSFEALEDLPSELS